MGTVVVAVVPVELTFVDVERNVSRGRIRSFFGARHSYTIDIRIISTNSAENMVRTVRTYTYVLFSPRARVFRSFFLFEIFVMVRQTLPLARPTSGGWTVPVCRTIDQFSLNGRQRRPHGLSTESTRLKFRGWRAKYVLVPQRRFPARGF